MNITRIAILAVAAIAAGAAALLVRGMIGGGTQQAAASLPQISTTKVLVAAADLQPGTAIDPSMVRWQEWPKEGISAAYITQEAQPDVAKFAQGAIVRVAVLGGEPITEVKVVHANSASFMAASLTPGKRAISIAISVESGAGGFILPNDRVDLILTRSSTSKDGNNTKEMKSSTLLQDVRVLAIDQTYREIKDQQVVIGKTATLELSPEESEVISLAQASGTISLALRSVGDKAPVALGLERGLSGTDNSIYVIRYGVARASGRIE